MKPGTTCTVFLIMLLLASCSRKENTVREKPVSSLKPQASSLRLQASRFKLHASPSSLSDKPFYAPDTFTYYQPGNVGDDLKKMKSLHIKHFANHREKCCDLFKTIDSPNQPVLMQAGNTSHEVFFTATWDNDLLDYTDHYFTNGIGFELFHPVISASPLARLLPGLKYSINYYGLSFIQNMYTPLKLNRPEVLVGDRPFASYLVLGHQRISLSPEKHRRLQTEISIGVIGPGALGNFAQDMIHTEAPTGWQYQVRNDFVLNYSMRYDHGLYNGKSLKIAAVGGGQAGTLYDNIMGGLFLQVGRANDRYGSIFQTSGPQKPYRKRICYYFSLDVINKVILYDATLEGGMFNDESVYTIESDQVKRYVFTGKAGFGIGFGKYSLEAEQVFLTPEFDGGRRHMWFRIKNIIRIN
jgi:lipid A 3-O-deacylase